MGPLTSLLLLAAGQGVLSQTEVPFRLGDDAIILDVVANGRKLALMFDTGFSGGIVLSGNINIGKPTGKITLRDFVGQFEAPTTKLTSLKLGSLNLDTTNVEAVHDRAGGQYSFAYNMHCDGIFGYGTLTKYVFEINFASSKFVFHPRTVDITKRTPDNQKTFLAKLLPTGHQSLEMEVLTSDNKRMIMALDTGNSFYATTHKDVLERVGLWQGGKQAKYLKSSFVASGEVATWYKKMKDLRIFGVPVAESTWSVIDLPSSAAESDGTVGFGFLKNFNMIIDFERRRVWLENFTGKIANEPVADVGISAVMDDAVKRVRVVRVAPDSPAGKAGVQRGDSILSIDGNDELDIGWRRLNKMFEGPKGSKVKLAISRNGNLMRFELERDFLIND